MGCYEESKNENSYYTFSKKAIKPITDYEIEIDALPESYSRADLIRLEESKKRMIEDSQKYVEEHMVESDKTKQEIDDFMKGNSSKNSKNKK